MNADLDALKPELARLDALIDAEIRRIRARYELTRDEFHGLYITDERVEALLRATQPVFEGVTPPDITTTRTRDTSSRWRQLADALSLSDDERDLVLIALAPELHPKYETLYAYLNDDATRRYPTPELAARLLGRDEQQNVRLRGLLSAAGKVLSNGAIEVAAPVRDEIRAHRPLRAAGALADWLVGLPYHDDRLTGVVRFGAGESVLPLRAVAAPVRPALEGLIDRFASNARVPPIVLSAQTPSEATLIAEELFSRAARPVLVLDLAVLRGSTSPTDVVTALLLAHRLLGAGIVAAPLDAIVDVDGRPHEPSFAVIRRLVVQSRACVVATGIAARGQDVLGDIGNVELSIPQPARLERAAAWQQALAGTDGIDADVVDALADRFALGVDRILYAARAARDRAWLAGQETPSSADLFAAARAVSVHGSGGTTQIVSSPFTWDDLILPQAIKARLADIIHAVKLRPRVLDAWGFARRLGNGHGLKIMFAGPSGVGKTMAAAIVAKTLQLDLHRLELGTVVSKYIGETEKNLDRAFDTARRCNAVLFIDEADALLGKRSEVKDAHDRYANVEIAYLLQKMDDHSGIVIVATNLARNIDDAFSRRMQYVLEFPLPDAASRERLWRGMLPAEAPVAADVDFAFLGRQIELSGGDIRNVALDAAYSAARDESEITIGHLLRAVMRQYEKSGRVATAAEFREFYALLLEPELRPA